MPHVIVKLYPGRTDQQKKQLTQKIVDDIIEVTGCDQKVVSVAFEEIDPEDWAQKVYKPDILDGQGELYQKPGYDPFAEEPDKKDESKNLMEQVRSMANSAAQSDTSGYFNAMSWLELELEDNPSSFDPFFETPWNDLSDSGKEERTMAIRRVL